MIDQWIKAKIRCCSCGGSFKDSGHINVVCLNKLATWQYPSWGNILVLDKYPMNRASAILCDSCIQERRPAKYAIEWNNERTQVKYHKVEDLKVYSRFCMKRSRRLKLNSTISADGAQVSILNSIGIFQKFRWAVARGTLLEA